MKQDRSLRTLLQVHWLSWLLLVMAYATYGGFLHHRESSELTWVLSGLTAIFGAWAITLGWPHLRRLLLLGFQSDLGYFVMALTMASLAVAAVTQFQRFAYFVMLVAVSLLARVDNLIVGIRDTVAFLWMSALALVGLALSWLPVLLGTTAI
ncbi:MAG TPA: hypothetical protein VLS96_21745 [Nodosilinea sp.]|nr:hypothetical protein [Nodosilinea sp.]